MSVFLSEQMPTIHLESMDGSIVIPLNNTTGWILMPGATGLEMPPVAVISSPIPGAPGSQVRDTRVQERPVFLPVYGRSSTSQRSYLQMMDDLRSLIDPMSSSFKVVGITTRSVRELVVTYDGGLEGSDGADVKGLSWCKAGINATAHQPFARARSDRRLEFRVAAGATTPFLGIVGGTDAPWPTSLASTAVVGEGMEVPIDSEVPVYPMLELVGPMDSFAGTLSPIVVGPGGEETTVTNQAWSVTVPAGVPAGSTFRMVTDPRARSIRMDGELAAGLVARGSQLRPFYPRMNELSVAAPGGTEETRIILSWRDLYRSLW